MNSKKCSKCDGIINSSDELCPKCNANTTEETSNKNEEIISLTSSEKNTPNDSIEDNGDGIIEKMNRIETSQIDLIKYTITKDAKKEIISWAWKPFAFILFMLAFLGITSWDRITTLQERIIEKAESSLNGKINTIYDATNVKKMVDSVIKDDARNIIKNQSKNAIDPIINDFKKEYAQILSAFKKDYEKNKEIIDMNELVIQAESGKKNAYDTLMAIGGDSQHKYSILAHHVARKIYDGYNKGFYSSSAFKPDISNENVINYLDNKKFTLRRLAVYSIGKRKMYNQIPVLLSMVNTEENIEVLAAIYRVLNKLLNAKVNVLHEVGIEVFNSQWEAQKDDLLKTQ